MNHMDWVPPQQFLSNEFTHARLVAVHVHRSIDPNPQLLQTPEAAARLEEYEAGVFQYLYFQAVGEIIIPIGGGLGVSQTIETVGVGQIESDQPEKALRKIEGEEMGRLGAMLRVLHVEVDPGLFPYVAAGMR